LSVILGTMQINSRVHTATAKIRDLENKMPYGENLKELSLEGAGGGQVLSSLFKIALKMVTIGVLSLLDGEYRKEFS